VTIRKSLAALSIGIAVSGSALAATEIQFWHAMTGALGDRVGSIAERFNASQSEYKVVPVFKGNYDETLSAGIAAFRAGNPPHILQVFEVGTATMMAAGKAIKPVYEVMETGGQKFDPSVYIPSVSGYYTTSAGKMLSMPFNSSTTVFYYNKDAFRQAGLDPEKPPMTWADVARAAGSLKAAGVECPYTTGWQSWVHLENFSAWHDVPFASHENGFASRKAELKFNSPLHVRHIEMLSQWAKDGWFHYAGRKNEGEAQFYGGRCAMLTSSSAAYANIKRNAKFEFAVAQLPYHSDVAGAPRNTIIGGASLWVMGGKKADEYKGVARFFSFLSSPEIQAEWHQATGYLPITAAASKLTEQQGFYEKNPGTDTSVKQMTSRTPTANSKGIRLGNFVQIRAVVDEELEAVWAGKKSPKEALDTAVRRGNELLRRFEKTAG
jgi:sn-glycerol 3-phosphate transport system substrate-binding protein